jgi:hypothetical protein
LEASHGLEQLARKGKLSGAAPLVDRLEKEMALFLAQLREWLKAEENSRTLD